MLFFSYPKCSTCQKAKNWLLTNKVSFNERNIKEYNPTIGELKNWHLLSCIPIKKFFNTSGVLYRELHIKEWLLNLSEDEMLTLLASNGMLVKRPIIINNDKVIIGFNEEEYKKLLL